MGVDAVIVAAVPRELTEREVREAAVKMASAFGAHNFWIWRPDSKVGGDHPQHALSLLRPDDEESRFYPTIVPKGGCLVECHTRFSYYGPGYERGSWPMIESLLRYLEVELGATMYYGGDSSYELDRVTSKFRNAMWIHFRGPNGRAYFEHRSVFRSGPRVRCDFCDVEMRDYGTSAGAELVYCGGCGAHFENRGGKLKRFEDHRHFGHGNHPPVPRDEVLDEVLRFLAASTLGEAEVKAASFHEEGLDGRHMTIEIATRWNHLTPDQRHAARERAIELLCVEAKKSS